MLIFIYVELLFIYVELLHLLMSFTCGKVEDIHHFFFFFLVQSIPRLGKSFSIISPISKVSWHYIPILLGGGGGLLSVEYVIEFIDIYKGEVDISFHNVCPIPLHNFYNKKCLNQRPTLCEVVAHLEITFRHIRSKEICLLE